MESTRIVDSQRKAILKNEELEIFKQSFVIVPYQVSGFIDFTNRGASNESINPEDFETFKRVWTGNDACVINWKNSIRLEQNEKTNEFEIKYQLGEAFLGLLELNSADNVIKFDESFSEYKSQEVNNRITFRVHNFFKITPYYQLMFFKIPEISGSTLYRIESIEYDYAGRELIGYVITFKTINQEFANTGRSRQQNIMPNSPGQGYLECVVEDEKWPEKIGKDKFEQLEAGKDYYYFFGRYITADFQKTLNRPVVKVVLRLIGNGILSSFTCVGRPVLQGDSFQKYRPQRLLFPYNFTNPTTPTLFHTQNNSNNLYFGDFKPTLEYFKDLMASIKDSLTPINQWKYQGWLKYNYDNLKKTNPIANNNYKYDLYGFLDTSTSPTVQMPWTFETEKKQIDTSGVYGTEQLYQIGGKKEIWNHMFDNFWTQKQFKVLPINQYSSTTFGWTLASALGLATTSKWYLALPLFYIGITGTLVGKLLPKHLSTFRGIISAPLIDYNNGLFKNVGGGNNIPFNMIDNDNKELSPSGIFFDSKTLTIGFEARLTDLIESERVPNKVLSTINIGQTEDEEGNKILTTNSPFNLNGDVKILPTYDHYSGYIIDSFKIQAIFNGEISVEFLDINNEIIWTGVYQSEGKWTGSMREIWTEKNCSVFGRENTFFSKPLPYPKEIQEPPSSFPQATLKTINDTKMKYEFFYSINGGGNNVRFVQNTPTGKQYIVTNHTRQSLTDIEDSGGYNLLENVSKEELLQVWSNVSINYGNNEFINFTMFEIFSNKDNAISKDISILGFYQNDVAVGFPPLPFPVGSGLLQVHASLNLTITIFWEDNTLKFKWKVKEKKHSTFFVVSLLSGVYSYLIFFASVGGTARANVNYIKIIPK